MNTNRGFALLIVLWALGLLALVVTQLVSTGHREVQRTINLRDAAVAEALADGAVYQTVFHVLERGPGHWPAHGSYEAQIGGRAVAIEITNAAGLVNPNIASLNLLQSLLEQVGIPSGRAASLAAAIVDWRTPGELVHPNGAKAPEYRAAGRDYGPPDAPIQDVSELAGVLGMTPEILQRLLPHLSVYAPDAPDPTLADAVVARALVDAGEPGARFDEGDNGVTFAISATALGPGDERFRRHAVVTTADATPSTPFRVLSWDQ